RETQPRRTSGRTGRRDTTPGSRPDSGGGKQRRYRTTGPGYGTKPGSIKSPGPAKAAGTRRFHSAVDAVYEIRASSRWPADESQSNHYYAKNNPVVHKRSQSAATQIMQEPGNHQAAGEGADGHAHQEVGMQDAVQAALLVHVVERLGGSRANGRGGEQEREARRRFARHVA